MLKSPIQVVIAVQFIINYKSNQMSVGSNPEGAQSPIQHPLLSSTDVQTSPPTNLLDHLKVASVADDTVDFRAAVFSYNKVISDLSALHCTFCGAVGHKMIDCPLKKKLRDMWEADPVRMHVLEGLIHSLRDKPDKWGPVQLN